MAVSTYQMCSSGDWYWPYKPKMCPSKKLSKSSWKNTKCIGTACKKLMPSTVMVDLGVWVMRQDLFYYRHRNIYPGAQMMSRISSSPSAPLSPTSLLWIIRNALKFSSKIAWLVEIKIIEFFWQKLFSFCGRVLKRLSMRDNLLVLIVCIRKEYIHTNLIA